MPVISTAIDLLRTLRYISKLGLTEGFGNPFRGLQAPKDRPIYVLGNGPSLGDFINRLQTDYAQYENCEFFAVNDFVNDNVFDKIKPKYYALSDPMFFIDTIYSKRGHGVIDALAQKVNWPITLFIPIIFKRSDYLLPLRLNKNIRIVEMHRLGYTGLKSLRNWIFKKGLGNGEYGTVVLNAIYAALLCNFKTIYVHGIDHNFFDNIVVNQDNVLCYRDSHFYETESQLRPMLKHYNGVGEKAQPFRVYEFLLEKTSIFQGHEIMSQFADTLGAKIVNCTPNSLVDSYSRCFEI